MLDRQNIKATFFIPGWVAEKYHKISKQIASRGHEIAHHGYLHEDCSNFSYEEEKHALTKGSEALGMVTGKTPRGLRLGPSKNTFKLLAEMGFLYESTLMDSDQPYRISVNSRPQHLIELPVSFAFNDTLYFVYTFGMSKPVLSPREVETIYRDEFDALYKEGRYCMYMLHPQIIGRASRLEMLERTIEYMKSRPGVWFTTAFELAKYCDETLNLES